MSESTVARRGQRHASVTTAGPLPALSPADLAHESEEALIARGAAYVRAHAQIKDKETTLLRNIAVVLVELRSRTQDADGRTDWHGRSHKYRVKAGELYASAGIPADSQASIQTAVRYHIGNHLRTVAPPEELADVNLKLDAPLEREQRRRKSRSAILSVARAEVTAAKSVGKTTKSTAPMPDEAPASAVADHIRLGVGAHNVLSQLSLDVIDEMTDGQRARLDAELEEIQRVVSKLRRHTRKRSSQA
ncbi:hypothetical protein [Streptomyces sp. NPDC091259]|uniref:hypothetical protein n=1 Tax=Streptomyces sp. NPDC091259 TaxID=3365976 RepID=UPI00382AE60F